MNFIEVTQIISDGKVEDEFTNFVNVSRVMSILPYGDSGNTIIQFSKDEQLMAKESYEEVKELIKEQIK